MIKSSVEKISDIIGFEIGTSDDETQAKLLNSFCKGLNNSIPFTNDLDMQLCYIADKLDSNAEKTLERLGEFIKVKNESRK